MRVHHDGAVPGHWFFDGLAGDEQEADAFVACLDSDFVAAVEEHQRVIFDVVDRLRIGFGYLFGQNGARFRGIAERAGAREHVSKGVARGLDFEPLALTGRNGNVEVIRISSHALDRPLFAPELATDDAHAGAIVVSDLGYGAGRNVLVTRVGHL